MGVCCPSIHVLCVCVCMQEGMRPYCPLEPMDSEDLLFMVSHTVSHPSADAPAADT